MSLKKRQEEPVWKFEELSDACWEAMSFMFNFRRKNVGQDVPWSGPSYQHANHLPPEVALRAEQLAYSEEDQGRDAMTELIAVILQLGIEQGRRITLSSPPVTTMQTRLETIRVIAGKED